MLFRSCFPTCVLNALVWLFERRELPGAVVQHVYAASLDGMQRGIAGSYTSELASFALIDWLTRYRCGPFAIASETLHGRRLNLAPNGRLRTWLRRGGVAIVDIVESANTTHSILALGAGAGHIDFWDPYPRGSEYDYGAGAARLASNGNHPNLRLAIAQLNRTRMRPYALGPQIGRAHV